MPKKIVVSDLPEFDLAQQLRNEADIAAYITMVIEEGDAAELAHGLRSRRPCALHVRNCTCSGIDS